MDPRYKPSFDPKKGPAFSLKSPRNLKAQKQPVCVKVQKRLFFKGIFNILKKLLFFIEIFL